jgi:hypothetical protein
MLLAKLVFFAFWVKKGILSSHLKTNKKKGKNVE